jgi:outer membrane protein assembly factor BamB
MKNLVSKLFLAALAVICLHPAMACAQATKSAVKSKAKSSAAAVAPASSQEWSCFRGPTGMGVSEAKGLPDKWSQSDNLAWKTKLPGPGASSPVVFGDRIYITCYSGFFVPGEEGNKKDLKRHLIALKRDSGVIIWDKSIAAKQPEEDRIRDHGFAASTPAVDPDRIYTFQGKTGVIAFDHDGKQLWQKDVGSTTHGWGSAASPVLWKNLVFINASVESDSLVALDRKTGDEKWRANKIPESWNTPVVVTADSGREELVVATQGNVKAFAPDSGKLLWTCKTDIGWYMVPSVVADKGIVYCLGGRSGVAGLAVKAGGEGDVSDTHRLWTSLKGSNVSSPVYLDGHLYWMHDSRGVAMCAKADTGELVYEKALNRAEQSYSSALLANGKVYYLTRNGRTFVVAAKPEFEQISMNDLGGRDQGADRSIFNGSPVPDGNRILIRSDNYLYCIGK